MASNSLSISSVTSKDSVINAYHVGFDVSKDKLNWSVIDQRGIEMTYGIVANDETELVALLSSFIKTYSDEHLSAVVESTSYYHYPLLHAAQSISMPYLVFNPILTK